MAFSQPWFPGKSSISGNAGFNRQYAYQGCFDTKFLPVASQPLDSAKWHQQHGKGTSQFHCHSPSHAQFSSSFEQSHAWSSTSQQPRPHATQYQRSIPQSTTEIRYDVAGHAFMNELNTEQGEPDAVHANQWAATEHRAGVGQQPGVCNFKQTYESSNMSVEFQPDPRDVDGGLPKCICGRKCVLLKVRKAGDNKGRQFLVCPMPQETQCRFFQWADEPLKPICPCGQQCTSNTVKKEGQNFGRTFYKCSKSHGGQCNFFQWADLLPPVPAVAGADCVDESIANPEERKGTTRSSVRRPARKKLGSNALSKQMSTKKAKPNPLWTTCLPQHLRRRYYRIMYSVDTMRRRPTFHDGALVVAENGMACVMSCTGDVVKSLRLPLNYFDAIQAGQDIVDIGIFIVVDCSVQERQVISGEAFVEKSTLALPDLMQRRQSLSMLSPEQSEGVDKIKSATNDPCAEYEYEGVELQVGDRVRVLPGEHFRKNGIDCYRADDVGTVTSFSKNDKGESCISFLWERTGQVSNTVKKFWHRQYKSEEKALAWNQDCTVGFAEYSQAFPVDDVSEKHTHDIAPMTSPRKGKGKRKCHPTSSDAWRLHIDFSAGFVAIRRKRQHLIQVGQKVAGSLDRAHAVATVLCKLANEGADRSTLRAKKLELIEDVGLQVPALGLDEKAPSGNPRRCPDALHAVDGLSIALNDAVAEAPPNSNLQPTTSASSEIPFIDSPCDSDVDLRQLPSDTGISSLLNETNSSGGADHDTLAQEQALGFNIDRQEDNVHSRQSTDSCCSVGPPAPEFIPLPHRVSLQQKREGRVSLNAFQDSVFEHPEESLDLDAPSLNTGHVVQGSRGQSYPDQVSSGQSCPDQVADLLLESPPKHPPDKKRRSERRQILASDDATVAQRCKLNASFLWTKYIR